jgi:hypothetical protein
MTCFSNKLQRSRAELLVLAAKQILPWRERLWALLVIRLPLGAWLLMQLWHPQVRQWIQQRLVQAWLCHPKLLWEDLLLDLAIWVLPFLQLIPWLILLWVVLPEVMEKKLPQTIP